MNINFIINKENEKVIVSNEKGTMETREYQDNIKAVLIKEDIVKELENDYSSLQIQRTAFQGKLEETNKKIEKCRKNKKNYWKLLFCVLLIAPILVNILTYILIKRLDIGIILTMGVISDGMYAIIFYFLISMSDSPFVQIKELEEEKEEYEMYIDELNLKIADIVQVLTKNKAELDELIEQKEKNNIQTMSTEVQEISYRESLEIEKSYLTQLSQENAIIEQEDEAKRSILSRFKKKNN